MAGFHAHLAAEKALKAVLIQLGVEVPRIHDLIGLHRLLPEPDQGRFDESDLEVLNPWTTEGRYPADLPDSDRSMIEETLTAARRVLDAATIMRSAMSNEMSNEHRRTARLSVDWLDRSSREFPVQGY